jgi:quinol monooxygenase YgiN
MPVVLIISFLVRPEFQMSFKKMASEVKVALVKEDGCTKIDVYQGHQDPKVFTLVEEWETLEKHQDHFKVITKSGAWDKILTQLENPPVMHYMHKL